MRRRVGQGDLLDDDRDRGRDQEQATGEPDRRRAGGSFGGVGGVAGHQPLEEEGLGSAGTGGGRAGPGTAEGAAAAAPLGGVHRGVRKTQQLTQARMLSRRGDRRADARADADRQPAGEGGHHIGPGQGPVNGPRRSSSAGVVADGRQQHRELIPAEAGGHGAEILRAAPEFLRGLGEDRVAGGVPVDVVDGLEVVQVDEQERGARDAGLADRQRGGRGLGQPGPVVETGEEVVAGAPAQGAALPGGGGTSADPPGDRGRRDSKHSCRQQPAHDDAARGESSAFGHDVAELLLARTARRLQAAAEDQEYVAHIGGDDFGVYLPTAGDPAHVRSRALQLVAAVAQPIELDVGRVTLSATAGAAYSPTPVGSGTELLRQAAVALEQARAANIPVDFYDPATDELGSPAAVVLASELHAALDDDQLELHYQPVVHIPSGAPVAMETLTRWRHPTKGLLYPPDFMTVLEHSPDHARFVAWQLAQALHTRSHWGARDLPVTINLAARCLLDREFPAQVAAALKHAKVKGNQLMFEVAETATLTEEGLVGDVLTELRRLGVQVAVDALGTGNSSLINLLRVPATHVKIGAHFVQQMLVDEEAMSVVCLALDLGRRADLQVVAVGVGTEEHVTALLQLGCDTAQGWYLASPMPTDELRAYLDSAPAAAPQPKDVVVSLDTRRRITPS